MKELWRKRTPAAMKSAKKKSVLSKDSWGRHEKKETLIRRRSRKQGEERGVYAPFKW